MKGNKDHLFSKKYVMISIIVVLVGLILFILQMPSFNEVDCFRTKEFKILRLKGIVYEKFIDSSNHSYKIIKFKNYELYPITLDFTFDNNNVYSAISIGDSLFKEQGSMNLAIKRRLDQIQQITVDFGCR